MKIKFLLTLFFCIGFAIICLIAYGIKTDCPNTAIFYSCES